MVGSSRNNKLGLVNNSTPIEVRFLSPPEIPLKSPPPILVCSHFVNPKYLIKLLTFLCLSSSETLSLNLAAKRKASLGV